MAYRRNMSPEARERENARRRERWAEQKEAHAERRRQHARNYRARLRAKINTDRAVFVPDRGMVHQALTREQYDQMERAGEITRPLTWAPGRRAANAPLEALSAASVDTVFVSQRAVPS